MKKMKSILAVVLTLVMALSLSTVAFAANLDGGGVTDTHDNRIEINQAVIITNEEAVTDPAATSAAEGVTVFYPALTFTYAISIPDADGTTDDHLVAKPGVDAGLTFSGGTKPAGSVVLNKYGQEAVFVPATFTVDLTKFASAGIYRYTITDTSTGAANVDNLTDAGIVKGAATATSYNLDVYITNGDSGLEVSHYVLSIPNEGKAGGFDNVDVDEQTPTPGDEILDTSHGPADLASNYSYTTYNVNLNKTVAGALGDKQHGFEFTVDVTTAPVTSFSYKITGSTNTTLDTADMATATTGTTFALGDGSVMKIWGLSPLAKIAYTEKNNTDYTYKVKAGTAANGDTLFAETSVAADGTAAVAARNVATGYNISTTANQVEALENTYFTNTLADSSPTGIVLLYAPYILILSVGMFLLMMSIRRKEDEEA